MTTTTDNGLEWVSDKCFDRESDKIDTVAIGTGTSSENTGDTSLDAEVYRASTGDANISFPESDSTGAFEAVIRVKGGTEVSAGTTISEIGIFAGGNGGDNVLLIRDVFSGVTVESGHTEEFTVPVDFTR